MAAAPITQVCDLWHAALDIWAAVQIGGSLRVSSGAPVSLGHSGRGLCRNVSMGDRPAGVPMIRVKPPADTGVIRMMFLVGVASAGVRAARGPGSALDQVPVPVAEGAGREP